jgi:single-strand DNA-binding protein
MASRSLNRVILIGNLTRDPELKYTPSGTAVCTFGVATNRNWTTSDGSNKEEVQYHRIVAWQKLAELCAKILTKGRKVYLEGRITYRTFTGKDGQQRSVTEIVLDDFIVFGNGGKKVAETGDEEITANKEKTEEKSAEKVAEPAEEEVPVEETVDQPANQNQEDVNPEDIPF